ncbi:MAG: glycosyltransferase family 2 protein [Verrucomicrobiaceae bacterium]
MNGLHDEGIALFGVKPSHLDSPSEHSHRLLLTSDATQPNFGFKRLLVPANTTEDEAMEIARKHSQNCRTLRFVGPNDTKLLTIHEAPALPWAPVRGGIPNAKPWEGIHKRKPWDFACEVVIPCLEPLDTIYEVVTLWRLQTVKAHIVLIDTGSSPETLAKLEALRADDLEVHSLRLNAVRHTSDFPAIAMDLAFSLCRTDKLVATHSDVFPRRPDVLAELLGLCSIAAPAVGYQMTERNRPGWEKVVAHSLACYYMPTMDRIGAGWSLRRACRALGAEHEQDSEHLGNLLDTELCLSLLLEQNAISPVFIGTERNFEQTLDDRMRHVRTLTGSRLYSPAHREKAERWLVDAMEEARVNIEAWRAEQ